MPADSVPADYHNNATLYVVPSSLPPSSLALISMSAQLQNSSCSGGGKGANTNNGSERPPVHILMLLKLDVSMMLTCGVECQRSFNSPRDRPVGALQVG